MTLLEERVVQAERAISPDIDPSWSPADGTETAEAGRPEVEQHTPRSFDDGTSTGPHHGAESTSDGSGEAEEA